MIETTEWVNEEWMTGRIGSREGIFPVGFVKIIKELPKKGIYRLYMYAHVKYMHIHVHHAGINLGGEGDT